jgi:hypothetical protein
MEKTYLQYVVGVSIVSVPVALRYFRIQAEYPPSMPPIMAGKHTYLVWLTHQEKSQMWI